MDRLYKFSVLTATPEKHRGERANIGVVVAGPDGLDIRVPEARKLRMLTGHRWENIVDAFRDRLLKSWDQKLDFEALRLNATDSSTVFSLSSSGEMIADEHSYESRLADILKFYVDRPVLSRAQKQDKINTEISRVLRLAGVLGSKEQTIDDHKVISKFVVSEEKELVADFAFKSRTLKIVSTLDLRGVKSAHGKACEKGATLYFARENFGSATKTFGVYAATPEEEEAHRGEIEILSSFAGGAAFNWLKLSERSKFQGEFYRGLDHS
jgi:hypothetical protein